MKYSVVLERLQNLINYIPDQSELCRITGVKQSTMSNRSSRNSDFSSDEIVMLNEYYNINLFTNSKLEGGMQNVKFYPVNVSEIVEIPYWEGLPDDLKVLNVDYVTAEKNFIQTHWYIEPESLRIVPMVGNKMYNYWYKINDNDVLIIDTSHNFIRGNGVYFATSRNNTRFWVREMQVLYNDDVEFKGFAPSGNTTRVLNKKQLEEVDFKVIGKVIKNVSFRL
jgi:hypothetical protein